MSNFKRILFVSVILVVLFFGSCAKEDAVEEPEVTENETEEASCSEHQFVDIQVLKEASCREEGQMRRACSVCKEEQTESIPKKEHSYGEWEKRILASCQQIGIDARICLDCGNYDTRTVIADHEFQYGRCRICGRMETVFPDTEPELTEPIESDGTVESEEGEEASDTEKPNTSADTDEETGGVTEESGDDSDLPTELVSIAFDKQNLLLLLYAEAELNVVTVPNGFQTDIRWISSDESVVTVENGLLHAVGEGEATVTARAENGMVASCLVSVISEGLVFPSMEMDGLNIKGVVSNATDSFSISREIVCKGNGEVSFFVSEDRDGEKRISVDTVSLRVGDNVFYVHEIIGERHRIYTLTVRRRPMYEVTFDTRDGSTVASQTVEEGSCISIPQAERCGYTLQGWSDDAHEPIMTDVRIEVIWVANQHCVSFDSKGGETVADLSVTYDGEYTLPTPTRIGYSFDGWYLGDEKVAKSGVWQRDGNLSLTAKWTACSYKISFEGTELSPVTVVYGEAYTLPTPSREGYTFCRWLCGEHPMEMSGVWSETKDVVLRAEWATNQYVLTLQSDNPSMGSTEGSGSYEYGSTVTARATVIHPIYVFLGWYDCEDRLVSAEAEYRFAMGEELCLLAKFAVNPALADFDFTIDGGRCVIQGVKDTQKKSYMVPSFADEIVKGAFAACNQIEQITLPFLGKDASVDRTDFLGYFFGAEVVEAQKSRVPRTLRTVVLTGGTEIGRQAFYECESLVAMVIPETVSRIGNDAFFGCKSLETVFFGGTASEWARISIGTGNSKLSSARLLFYSQERPSSNPGGFWRFVGDVPTKWENVT